jgi:hypothetical protein
METHLMPKKAEFLVCEICDFKCCKRSNYNVHLSTGKHLANVNGDQKKSVFCCKKCNKIYNSNNGLWKHSKSCITNNNSGCYQKGNIVTSITENAEKAETSKNKLFSCEFCNKEYKSRKGLWSHNRTCTSNKDKVIDHLIKENSDFKNIVMEMMKSNSDLQKQLVDVCKNSNNTINSNNNISNKTFNLQFFLNEQCKDAMNINDFVNSFELQLIDLESVGNLGYVEGITKQFLDKLNGMDIYKRPMHCSDSKRETIYIKDEDKWEKEERGTPKLRKAIKTVSFNNLKLVVTWSDTYPESKNIESRLNDKYVKLVKQTTGGNGELSENEDKIIRRIAKEIIIEKS